MPYKDPIKQKEWKRNYRQKRYAKDAVYRKDCCARVLAYYKKHRDKKRKKDKKYYYAHKAQALAKSKRRNENCPDKSRYAKYVGSAKKRKLEFTLSFEQFAQLTNSGCFYCGLPPSKGVDRINNQEGYIPSNSAPCCSKCNYMKGKLTKEEFLIHCRKVVLHNGVN